MRMLEKNKSAKEQEMKLWGRLGNPAFDSPQNPEALFSDEALAIAKRGRMCAVESAFVGSNVTKRSIRDHARSARRHGNSREEVGRLCEYPEAVTKYKNILRQFRSTVKNTGN